MKIIFYFKNLKTIKLQATNYPSSRVKLTTGLGNLNKGMSYVELIVVLGIFAVMSSVVIFNYSQFQSKVDIKSLASDIALKIVEAQKSSLSGNSPNLFQSGFKPSFGVYFDSTSTLSTSFIYFADKNNNSKYDSAIDTKLDTIIITKNNKISSLEGVGCTVSNNLGIVFVRPDSSAKISSNSNALTSCTSVKIKISSPRSDNATITVYPSGRVQVN